MIMLNITPSPDELRKLASLVFVIIIIILRSLAQSRRLKINNYGWIWLSFRFERALKRDCICQLDDNGKTLKEVNGLECMDHP